MEKAVDEIARDTNNYFVKRGDTLGGLATRFSTTVSGLQSLNSISDPDKINVGQQLTIR